MWGKRVEGKRERGAKSGSEIVWNDTDNRRNEERGSRIQVDHSPMKGSEQLICSAARNLCEDRAEQYFKSDAG